MTIEQYIKGKAEEKYGKDFSNKNHWQRACYASGCKDTLELMPKFLMWAKENFYVLVLDEDGNCYFYHQSDSNETVLGLLTKYLESINK